MPPIALDIAIVGSGSGGPAAAALLAEQGHRVGLFEQSPVQLPVGAGFLLQPTGLAVLDKLGCLETLLPQVARITRLYCRTKAGRALLDLTYSTLQDGLFGAGTHRPALLDTLLKACRSRGVVEYWGHEAMALSRDDKGRPYLHFKDKPSRGPFDLLVISDGARSRLRATTGIPHSVKQYAWGALWRIGRRLSDLDPTTLWQAVDGTRQLIGFLPTGTGDDLVSLFWSMRADHFAQWRERPIAAWKREAIALAPQAEAFIDSAESPEQFREARYLDVSMKRWHTHRIAIVGDAAHALSPQLGQGVNLALCDAACLASRIAEAPLDRALPAYTQARRAHTRFYQTATRALTPLFQSDAASLGYLRDGLLPIFLRIPWLQKQMTATVAGLKTGILSQMPLPPAPDGAAQKSPLARRGGEG